MNSFYRKTRKLFKNPSLFFRDMLIKKYPILNKHHSVKNTVGLDGDKRKTVASKPSSVALGKSTPKVNKALDVYIENFDNIFTEENTILFESYSGKKIACNPYAVYRELNSNKDFNGFKFIWVVTRNTYIPSDIKNNERVTLVDYLSDQYALSLIKSKFLINNWIFPPFFIAKPDQKYINLWHGIPIKKLGLDIGHMGFDEGPPLVNSAYIQRNYLQTSLIGLAGDYARDTIVNSYGKLGKDFYSILYYGSARIDNSFERKIAVEQALSIQENKKILLFAPTWRGAFGNLSLDISDQINAIDFINSQLGNYYQVFFSIHHGIKDKISKSLLEKINLVPEEVDINDFLSITDILISDYSSISLDFLALDRPIVLYTPDLEEYNDYHGIYEDLSLIPAYQVSDLTSLIDRVKEERKPSNFDNYNESLNKFIPYEDGFSVKRLIPYFLDPKERLISNEKKSILIYPGALLTSGITSSFLSLIENINYDIYDVYIIIDSSFTDKNLTSKDNFRKINKNCYVIYRAGGLLLRSDEKKIYKKYQNPSAKIDYVDEAIIKRVFERESNRTLGRYEFDIAIDFSGYSPYWSLLIANSNSKSKIIYQHSDLYEEANSLHETRRRPQICAVFRSYKFYDKIVSVTEEISSVNFNKLKSFYTKNNKITFCPNTISPHTIKEKSSFPLSLISTQVDLLSKDKSLLKFVSVGRLSPEKNQARLIKAFSLVINEGINSVLFLVGDGPSRKDLEKLSKRLKVQERVIFLGQQDNPYPILAASDCLVLPSDYEGQGIVLLESMTLGVPCIGNDIPAVRAILENGVGYLFCNDYKDLARKMMNSDFDRIGLDKFDSEKYMNQSMDYFYKNVCSF